MLTTSFDTARLALRTGSALGAIALASLVLASPASAQDTPIPQTEANAAPAPAQATPPATPPADESAAQGDIVVTGTLFRRTDTETASPITTLSTENLQRAGINNIADAVRSISADNSGSIPTAFTGGFGQGAAAVSLRGLSVNSTLVVIDGIRTVNYPLADDGQRSFVDLNSIPQSTIKEIQVLKDGASSTYGADAIGGVVNIITKKEVKGLEGTVEAGTSQRGDGAGQRATLTAGYGDLSEQGFNVYVNAEYQHDGSILTKQRRFPYDTADLTSIGGVDGEANLVNSGQIGTVAIVRPATQTTPGDPFSGVNVPGGTFQILNPNQCALVGSAFTDPNGTGTACKQNLDRAYGTIQPEQTRYGFSGRATVNVGENAQAYLTGGYYQSHVESSAYPSSIRSANPINTTAIVLPALLSNGQLNPNNPYAQQGLAARIYYRFGDIDRSTETTSKVYRAAAGISGSFGEGWRYSVDLTGAKSDLNIVNYGALNIPALVTAVNTGSYNFVNPELNSQATRDALTPAVSTRARAELYMAQASITKELVQLPGGPLQVGIGGAVRREILDQPNQNANQQTLGLNAYSASGRRTVSAGYFEIQAPLLTSLELNASGRYDHYSDGFSRFSPKVGATFTPFRELKLRGTYSKGFRAPSFPESTQGSVIGYTTTRPPASVIAEHGNNAYVQSYSIGFNSSSNPNLRPELSRSFTGGAVFQPTSWLSFTADYYNIKKTDIISGGPLANQALAAYYANPTNPALPAGYTLTLDTPDPAFPNATRRVLIVNSPYANAASLLTSGIDVSMQASFKFNDQFRFTSRAEVTEVLNYEFKASDDTPKVDYVGTQAPYVLSSGAGTPRWRANWQNTAEYGPATLSLTTYYTSGYKNVAEDQNGVGANTCDDNLYGTGELFCHTKGFITNDLTGQFKVNDKFTFYVNVINLLDVKPPLNPANYAALNYNPTWSQAGIVGRFFRAGANFKF